MHDLQATDRRRTMIGVKVTSRLLFGVVVIVLGVVFTLDNLGFMDSSDVLRWWPVIPLLYGLSRLTGIGSNRNPGAGVVMSFVGVWLLMHNFDLVSLGLWDLWPLVLIVLGITVIFRSLDRSRRSAQGEYPDANLSAFALWSGVKRKITSQDFRGGDVTAIMGGHDIDLRPARVAVGGAAVIDVFVWWGGVELTVPEDWEVTSEAMVLMGGVDDRSKTPATAPAGRLIIKGLIVMGGIEIKNSTK
jgi:hypothetical protein